MSALKACNCNVKNNWRQPWLRDCQKHICFHWFSKGPGPPDFETYFLGSVFADLFLECEWVGVPAGEAPGLVDIKFPVLAFKLWEFEDPGRVNWRSGADRL